MKKKTWASSSSWNSRARTSGPQPQFADRLNYDVVDLATPEELERRYVRDGRSVYPACYVVHLRTRAG